MDITQTDLDAAIALINRSKRILLVSHRRPDGDTLGATIAMHFALSQMGKDNVLACIDEIPGRFSFLENLLPITHSFVCEFDPADFDLYIICDSGAHHMTGFHEQYPGFLSKKVPILNIDHHFSNEGFGTVNLVDSKASCAAVIVWKLIKLLPVKFNKEMAIALLTGIYNDTGGLMYSNTNKETFEAAGDLASLGVEITDIVRPLFKESTFSQLKLWGYILENLKRNEKNVISSVVTESDFKILGAHSSDTGGIVDLMNTVPSSAFTMLLAEDEGWVKGSLRTQRDDVNLSDLASQFGGGGHPKASGFRVQGRLEKQIVWRIAPVV